MTRSMAVLSESGRLLNEEFGIQYATLQIEPGGFDEVAEAVHDPGPGRT